MGKIEAGQQITPEIIIDLVNKAKTGIDIGAFGGFEEYVVNGDFTDFDVAARAYFQELQDQRRRHVMLWIPFGVSDVPLHRELRARRELNSFTLAVARNFGVVRQDETWVNFAERAQEALDISCQMRMIDPGDPEGMEKFILLLKAKSSESPNKMLGIRDTEPSDYERTRIAYKGQFYKFYWLPTIFSNTFALIRFGKYYALPETDVFNKSLLECLKTNGTVPQMSLTLENPLKA